MHRVYRARKYADDHVEVGIEKHCPNWDVVPVSDVQIFKD